jgi:aminopeptidase N
MAGGQSLALQRAMVGGFLQWGQEDLLRPYVEPYYEALPRIWDERPLEEALTLADGLFPHTLVEEDVVGLVAQPRDDGGLPGPLQRVVAEGADGLARALRTRAADRD